MANSRLWVIPVASVLLVSSMGGVANALTSGTGQASVGAAIAQAQQPDQGQDGPRQRRGGRQHRRIDFAAAAARLGTTEANLRQALGLPAQTPANEGRPNQGERRRSNLQQAAAQLNVSEERLRQALGITVDPQTGQPTRPRTRPNLQQVASQLGVTEAQLRTALGMPAEGARRMRPRLDIAGAAARLGVTEQQMIDALGIPPRPANGQRPNQRLNQRSNQQPTNQ